MTQPGSRAAGPPSTTERPLPRPDPVTQTFWKACDQHTLRYQHCPICEHDWLPASVVCPRCWSDETMWVEASGAGTVFTYAVYRRAYHPAFKPLIPYAVAVIELAEGPRLISNVVDVPVEEIHVGMEVRLTFIDAGTATLPVFRPAKAGE